MLAATQSQRTEETQASRANKNKTKNDRNRPSGVAGHDQCHHQRRQRRWAGSLLSPARHVVTWGCGDIQVDLAGRDLNTQA